MKNNLLNRRIPTFIGLLFLLFSVGLVTFIGGNTSVWQGRASEAETPKNIEVSNISDKSFTISFTTDIKTISAVAYGTSVNVGPIAIDDRDRESGKPSPRQTHYITVSGLEAEKTYYYTIQSGSVTYSDGSVPFSVTTGKMLGQAGSGGNETVKGSVILPDGNIPLEGIAYVYSEQAQKLSVLLMPDGSFSMPLSGLRSKDLSAYLQLMPKNVLDIAVRSPLYVSNVRVLAGETNPVPLITLSTDYDFAAEPVLPGLNSASDSASASPSATMDPRASDSAFPAFNDSIAAQPEIIVPEDGQEFTDQQPLFEGTAMPNKTVEIIIESDEEIRTVVIADSAGNWVFRPSSVIASGDHVLTIVTEDAAGVVQRLSRGFTVFASGSQFNEPSVSPQVSIAPTASPSPTVVPSTPTVTPNAALTSAALSLTPNPAQLTAAALSLTPDPAQLTAAALSLTPDPESLTATARARNAQIPASGNITLVLTGIIAGLSLLGGFVLFFL